MTKLQRTVHIISEATAVAIVVPFLFHVARKPKLGKFEKGGLVALAISTILVDGWLLHRYVMHDATEVNGKIEDVANGVQA